MMLPDASRLRQEQEADSVAKGLRPVATHEEPHYTAPNRNAAPIAGSFRRPWNSHDPATAGNFTRDGNCQQAPGRGPGFAQSPEAGCERGPQHSLPNLAAAQAARPD